MRVLVLGGTQFIGPYVVRRLVQAGHDVTVFHRGRTQATLPAQVMRLYGNRDALPTFASELRAAQPDIVLDMIASTRAHGRDLVNVFDGYARRVVVLSSLDVYRAYDKLRGLTPGDPDPTPLLENGPVRERLYPYRGNAPFDPDREYDKLLVEHEAMAIASLPATVLRLPRVYGPNDPQQRTYGYVKRMLDGRPIILLSQGHARWRASRGFVEDVAFAVVLAVTDDRASGKLYNVSEAHTLDEERWVRTIGEELNWSGDIVTLPNDRLPPHLQSALRFEQDWTLDSTRLRLDLGFKEEITPREALRRTVAWQRNHSPGDGAPIPFKFDYEAEDRASRID